MRSNQTWLGSILAGIAVWGGTLSAAHAGPSPVPFTWDPAAVGLAGSAFTADTINQTEYVRDDGIAPTRVVQITSFSLNGGSAFTPTGLGSSYGLYFAAVDHGIAGPPPHILTFTAIDITLKADPGNQNGAVISTPSEFHFTNTGPTGAADDIVLATGSLVSGALFLDVAAGILNSDNVNTFVPIVAGFFQGGTGFLHNVAANPASLLMVTPGPGGTSIINFNGIFSTAQFIQVPEPQAIMLLAAGLLGLGLVRQRGL
jgi:hypothetical protein